MHSAPAVSYPVGRSYFQACLLTTLALLTALVMVVWVFQSALPDLRHVAAALLWLLTAAWSTWQWLQTPSGSLAWDGRCWTWSDARSTQAVQLAVVLDMQSCLLLRLHVLADQCTVWVWPERRSAWVRWQALRRAVFSQQPKPESVL